MKTSAIIVTYNSAQHLPACLASIRDQVDEIIVVDNASNDQSVIASLCHPGQRPFGRDEASDPGSRPLSLPQSQNLGFSTAANIGAEQASGNLLLFLNPDTVITAGAIVLAKQYFDVHSSVGVIGLGLRSPANQPEVHSFGQEPTLVNLFIRKIISQKYPSRPTIVDWISGAALMVRADLFHQLKGFDPAFFLYWEDVDLCRRVRQAGFKVALLPATTVVHQGGASLSSHKLRTDYYDQSADRYYRKHYPTMICQLHHLLRGWYRSH